MLRAAFLGALTLLLLGCGGAAGPTQGATGTPVGEGNWFCRSTSDGEDWDCVQDPELAQNPRSARAAEYRTSQHFEAAAPTESEDSGLSDVSVEPPPAMADAQPASPDQIQATPTGTQQQP